MANQHSHRITRRDFIKIGGAVLGGAALAGCGRRARLIELTATPTPLATATQLLPTGTATAVPAEVAETILVNGNIVTMDAGRSIARGLAIKNGLILATGDEQAMRNLAGEHTQIIDLGGRTVTPGLIDAHCHLSACGLLGTAFVDISWPKVSTIEAMQQLLAERIATTPAGEWVIASGWLTFQGRYPTKHDLDPVSPNHPVFALNQGGHMAAVNSLALEMAGVNASTPDPGNGRFLRDDNGEPNGTVLNHPAMDYFRKLWPASITDVGTMETSILTPQATFASYGVTSFQDVYARDMERVQAYFNIARRGEMTIRGQFMNVLEYARELEGRIQAIESRRYEDDYMHFAGAKFQVDGGLEASFTHEPHNGIAYDIPIWQPEYLNLVVGAFHDAGYQVSIHTIGDAALDMALDAIELAMNANPRPDPRHRIEHCVLGTPASFQREKELGVIISTQPTLIRTFADGAARIWGEERAQQMVPTRTWLEMGIPICLSSDAPSMPFWDPQHTLWASLMRLSPSNKPISQDQALTMEEAMYAHTMAGAYADFAEGKKGSLEAGKFADLAVWHDDPYAAAIEDIVNLTIDMTMVGGKVVYQA